MSRHALRGILAAAITASIVSCSFDTSSDLLPTVSLPRAPIGVGVSPMPLRVWDDPYAEVEWTTSQRLLAQTHDHAANITHAILAYDSAGYEIMPLMDYSGVASLPYARRGRLWPADSVLSAAARLPKLNIKTWTPSAEEVGFQHIVSLFLTDYIAKWEDGTYPARLPWMYGSTQEAIDLVSQRGGFPILAHPWGPARWTSALRRYRGIEVYSAFAEQQRARGIDPFFVEEDRNAEMLDAWDRSLASGDLIVGFAVNDHFGPDSRDSTLSPRIRDSGKSIVLASDTSLAAIKEAILAGQVFAVRDFGVTKRAFARIDSLWYSSGVIRVVTSGTVRWIADGRVIAGDVRSLVVEDLPPATRFVRVEVSSPDGSVVYAQPMRLRPRGDVNGDFLVNSRDATICANAAVVALIPRYARACASRVRYGIN